MELWTPAHTRTLPATLAVMVLVALLLRKCLLNKPLKYRMIPVQVLTVVILLLEAGKQIVSFSRGYDLYHIPLHYCSLFIFMLPLMAFYKGKHESEVRGVAAGLCAAVTALMLIYPNLIYGAWDIENYFREYMGFHTVTYHNIVIFVLLLTLALELHTPQTKKEPGTVILFMAGFCAVSAIAAQLLKTNYANFYECNIPPCEGLRVQLQGVLGYVPTQILYILAVSVLTIAFTYGAYWLYRWLRQLAVKNKKTPVC